MNSVELFESIAERLQYQPDVTRSKMFGTPCLKVHGKVFAMLFKDNLVVKLPREQVQALIDSGEGERFDPGHGRIMKEWVSMKPQTAPGWSQLAETARDFVASS